MTPGPAFRCVVQVDVLNSDSSGSKEKILALSTFSDLARVKSERNTLFRGFQRVSERFEKLLDDKHRGSAQFGTALGRYHELTAATLMRLMDYDLKVRRISAALCVCYALCLRCWPVVIKLCWAGAGAGAGPGPVGVCWPRHQARCAHLCCTPLRSFV